MGKAAVVVQFVFPTDVARSLIANLPHVQLPPELSVQGTNPLTRGMLAFTQHDTAGVSQAIQEMALVKERVSAARQGFARKEEEWMKGQVQFTCAMQVARIKHAAVSAMPDECARI
jgi:hypothetical protein